MSWWPVLIPARFPTLFCPSTLLFNQAAGVGSPRTYSAHSPQPWIALVSGSLVRYPMGLGSPAMQSRLCPGLSPGGWLGSQTRHSLRSLSLQQRCLSSCQPVTDCVFRSPWSARIPALPRESGEVSQPGCRCYVPKRFVATAASVVLALRLGSSFVRWFLFLEK